MSNIEAFLKELEELLLDSACPASTYYYAIEPVLKEQGADIQLFNNGRRHVGHNGEAALRVCVPANEVSDLIFLLYAFFNEVHTPAV